MKKFIYIVSLGCPKNLVDTEVIAGVLAVNGIGFSAEPEDADIYFINTCAFIPPAREEAESCIQDAILWKDDNINRKIIIGGCLTNWDKKGLFRQKYPLIDCWLSSDDIKNIYEHIVAMYKKDYKPLPLIDPTFLPTYLYDEKTPRLQITPEHYAYLKIADGCNNNCSYCTIPGIRGHLRCRTVESVLIEAQNLINNNVKELIITAQDITAFNENNASENLAALIYALDELEGDFQIRLLYAHPAHFTEETIEMFNDTTHLLHYLDMPLQHISDNILRSMNRHIGSCDIRRKLYEFKSEVPDIAIRTTFIIGYPGETDENFQELYEFVKEQRFARMGAFVYYPEPGTPAASMQNQVPAEIAEKRLDALMTLQAEISFEMNEELIGKTMKVLVDNIDTDSNIAIARTYMDAPDIDNEVIITDAEDIQVGDLINVEITQADTYELEAILF